MTTYGFRLFELEIFEEAKRKPLNFAECGGQSYSERVKKILLDLQTTEFLGPAVGQTESSGAEDYTGRQYLRVKRLHTAAPNTFFGEVYAAKVGSIPDAYGLTGVSEDQDLRKNAPAREAHRFLLLIPKGAGTALLIVEAAGRSCPSGPVQHALTGTSKKHSVAAAKPEKEEQPPWFRVKLTAISDPAHLQAVIMANNAAEIVLTKAGPSASRTPGATKDVELQAAALSGARATKVFQLLKQWSKAKKDGKPVTDKEGAAQLAKIIGKGVEDIDFDEGALRIEDDGRYKVVRPALLEDVFTYPTKGHLTDELWFLRVAGQAQKTSQGTDVNVEWPEWKDFQSIS